MNKILEQIRFKIALYLNRNPKACWANLVMWAIGYQTFTETFDKSGNWKARICDDMAYCGKCREPVRLPAPKE